MTKYECAQQFLKLESLPPKQLDNLEVLERQIIDIGLRFYTSKIVNLDDLSLESAKEKLKELASSVHFLAKMLLVAGCDIHHFRAVSLARFIEVPPEMQIDDIISRLAARDCDSAHEDTEDVALFGENAIQEKGKEEEKEKIPPHPPIEKKGEESQKEPPSRARARKGRKSTRLTKAEKDLFKGFFNTFWEEYPTGRKVDRYGPKYGCEAKLLRHFKKAKDKEAFVREFLESFHKYLACPDWGAGYIPLTTTFINQQRWKEKPRESRTGGEVQRGVSQTANVKSNRAGGLW